MAAEAAQAPPVLQEPDPPHPAPANPMFAGVRVYRWRQYAEPALNAQSFLDLINWIIARLAEQAAADNVTATFTQTVNGNDVRTIALTARSGFFIVLVTPPEGWVTEDAELALVFSFKNLYLIGFLDGQEWRVYKDSALDGSGNAQEGVHYHRLQFDGGYFGIDTPVNQKAVYQACETLLNYAQRSRNPGSTEVRRALYCFIVMVAEAVRFPIWRSYLWYVLRYPTAYEGAVNNSYRNFGTLFTSWDTISKKALDGADAYALGPIDLFVNYDDLLRNIGVALRRKPDRPN